MARPTNQLAPETVEFLEGVGGWTVTSNATLTREPHFHPYHIPFSSTTQGNSLRVQPVMAGNAVVRTEGQSVAVSAPYKGSLWVTGTSEISVELELHVLDSGASDVSPDPAIQTIPANAWILLDVEATLDSDASSAYLQVTFTSPSASDIFWIAQPTMVELSATSTFVSRAYDTLPDYLIEGDKSVETVPMLPLVRFMTLGGRLADQIADDVIDFDYLRATDADDGVGYLSLLGDPQTARAEWLGWLANQVGVRLHLPDGGFTTWDDFVEAGIRRWDHWNGEGPSNPFLGMDSYDSAAVQGILDDFRRQIEFGTNGIVSSSITTLSDYIGSLLQEIDPTPWVYIRKRYKDNPWKVGVVVKAGADPGGTLLEKATMTATPAGVKPYVLNNVSRSAKVLYSAEDFADRLWGTGGTPTGVSIETVRLPIDENDSSLPDVRIKFIEDEMGTGRNLVLWDYLGAPAPWVHGGGIGLAQYFDGHAFYTGGTSLQGVASSETDIVGDLDVRMLLSDLRVDAGADRILMIQNPSGNKWQLGVDTTTGLLRLRWYESDLTWRNIPSTEAPYWDNPDPFWVRATLDVDNGDTDAEIKFWTKSVENPDWEQLGDTVLLGATTDIDSVQFAPPTVASIYDTTGGGLECVVYIAEMYDGIDGTLAWRVDLTDTTNAEISTGVETFDDVGPDPAEVQVAAWTEATAADYDPKYTLLHDHNGIDYLYFGRSPYKHNNAYDTGLGDTLAVDMGSSNTYYWRIYYIGGSTQEDSETTQVITWDSDDYGGSCIEAIHVRTGSHGGTVVGTLVPFTVSQYEDNGDSADGVDGYGKTWTLTRAFTVDVGNPYYETSYVVDRPSINVLSGKAKVRLGGFGAGSERRVFRHEPQSYMVVYKRWHPNSYSSYMDMLPQGSNESHAGILLGHSLSNLRAVAGNGVRVYELLTNESSRMGKWNLAVLRMSPTTDAIELVLNGTTVGQADSYFTEQYAYLEDDPASYISVPHAVDFNLSPIMSLAVKFYPDGPWGTGTYEIAKKWGGAGARSWRIRLVNGDLEVVLSADGTNIAKTFTYTMADPGHAVWLVFYAETNYNSDTETRFLLYVNWQDEYWNGIHHIDTDIQAGSTTIFASNAPIELGTDFAGRIYGVKMGNTLNSGGTLDTWFQALDQWDPGDTSQTGQQGNTINLMGTAHIARFPLADRYPPNVPDVINVNNHSYSFPGPNTTHFAAMGVFDHYLTDDEIDDLMTEYNIT